jgi:hypothetical protein
VPTSIGRANGPIGQHDRQFSSNPERVSRMVGAFIAGMRAGGVAATVKHFPGIGRITGNTDFTSSGITDRTTTVDDPFLEPFRTGIQDGVELVMVGSAIYSRIDPGTNATFSKAIVTDLLRGRLSYDGVVITDDGGPARDPLHPGRRRHHADGPALHDPRDARRDHAHDGRRPGLRQARRGRDHPGRRPQAAHGPRPLPLNRWRGLGPGRPADARRREGVRVARRARPRA